MSEKNVIVIITPYAYPHIGGIETVVKYEMMYLKKMGWDVEVITSDKLGSNSKLNYEYEKNISRLKSIEIQNNAFINPFKLWHILKKKQAKIYHLHSFPSPVTMFCIIFLSLLKRKFVLTTHYHPPKWHRYPIIVFLLVQVMKFIIRLFSRNCLRIFVLSSEEFKDISGLLPNFKGKISIIPWGTETRDNIIILPKTERKNFLYIGRLAHNKNVELLFKIFKKLNFLKIVIAGKICDKYIEKYINNLPANIYYLPYLDETQMEKLYREAIALILPSKFEAFGLVILEALSYGTPCIVSDGVRGKGIIYNYKVGHVFNNEKELEEYILKFYSMSTEEYNELSNRCINAAKELSWSKVFTRFNEEIIKLIKIS